MSDLISRTARLMPYTKRPKHAASFVTGYIYEPAADEAGAKLGNLYVIIEALVSGRASEEVVDLIIQTAGEKYYNEAGDEADPLARFEAAVKQTNHELAEYVGRGNAAWIGKLSAIIAVQSGHELHVTQTGSAEAFLYRGKAVSRISVTESTRPATPSKTFGSIATGELEVGDKLLIATPALVHQVPLARLQAIVSSTSPNTAIQELSQVLRGASTSRIAAIIVEITTPELAALKVRSDDPPEIELGNDESITESAIKTAAPIAHATADTTKRAAQVAANSWQRTQPHLSKAAAASGQFAAGLLRTRRGRVVAAAAVAVIVVVVITWTWLASAQAASAKDYAAYQKLYEQYITASANAAGGDKDQARLQLLGVQSSLDGLGGKTLAIDNRLRNSLLEQGEPNSVAAFKDLVASKIDELDGLVKVTPVTLAQIGGKSGRPTFFESDGSKAYVIDTADKNKLSIVNLLTGTQKESAADFSVLDDVKSTTLTASGDGMFILTSKPSVWLYRFSTDTLTEQTLAYGKWPAAGALGTYASNLYFLDDTGISKHVKNASGYSPKTTYIQLPAGTHPTALAIDGLIYTASDTGLTQYLGTAPKVTAVIPEPLRPLTNLRSAGGNYLIGINKKTNRIGVWSTKNNQLTFSKQLALSDTKGLSDALYDPKQHKVFATAGNRFVSFELKP